MKKILLLLIIPFFSHAQNYRYSIVISGTDTLIFQYSDTAKTVQVNKEEYSKDLEFLIRKEQLAQAKKYIMGITTATQYSLILSDLRLIFLDYESGSDFIISWLKAENSPVYGNFTTTGFTPSKSYYSVARQAILLNILKIQ